MNQPRLRLTLAQARLFRDMGLHHELGIANASRPMLLTRKDLQTIKDRLPAGSGRDQREISVIKHIRDKVFRLDNELYRQAGAGE